MQVLIVCFLLTTPQPLIFIQLTPNKREWVPRPKINPTNTFQTRSVDNNAKSAVHNQRWPCQVIMHEVRRAPDWK